jgi:hypothetical protein
MHLQQSIPQLRSSLTSPFGNNLSHPPKITALTSIFAPLWRRIRGTWSSQRPSSTQPIEGMSRLLRARVPEMDGSHIGFCRCNLSPRLRDVRLIHLSHLRYRGFLQTGKRIQQFLSLPESLNQKHGHSTGELSRLARLANVRNFQWGQHSPPKKKFEITTLSRRQ